MKEELNDLLVAISYDLKERLSRFDMFTDKEYEQGIIDGINICIGLVEKYK